MTDSSWPGKPREILAITYHTDILFASGSSVLNPSADTEVGRIAHLVQHFPHMTIDVEVNAGTLDTGLQNRALQKRRMERIERTFLEEGVDPWRIRTSFRVKIHGTSQTLSPEDTIHFRVSYGIVSPPWDMDVPCNNLEHYPLSC